MHRINHTAGCPQLRVLRRVDSRGSGLRPTVLDSRSGRAVAPTARLDWQIRALRTRLHLMWLIARTCWTPTTTQGFGETFTVTVLEEVAFTSTIEPLLLAGPPVTVTSYPCGEVSGLTKICVGCLTESFGV